MARVPTYFGEFPCPPTDKRPMVITKDMMKTFIYPMDKVANSDLNWLIASTDKVFCAMYQLPPGGTFDPPDVHAGDEPYYILKGTLTMINPSTGQVVRVSKGEALNIPMGVWHKAYNFGEEELKILVMIAPKPWAEQGTPDSFPDEMKVYKYNRVVQRRLNHDRR